MRNVSLDTTVKEFMKRVDQGSYNYICMSFLATGSAMFPLVSWLTRSDQSDCLIRGGKYEQNTNQLQPGNSVLDHITHAY